jgi:hypothetical protein
MQHCKIILSHLNIIHCLIDCVVCGIYDIKVTGIVSSE